MPKRKSGNDPEDSSGLTPKRLKRSLNDDGIDISTQPDATPARRSALRTTPSKVSNGEFTPTSTRRVLFSSTKEADRSVKQAPSSKPNERSARRKSAWTLQQAPTLEDVSEAEDDDDEIALAQEILQDDEEQDNSVPSQGATQSRKLPFGRLKGKRRELENLLLNHDDYREHMTLFRDAHQRDAERLQEHHKHAFDQWLFELEEDYNLCLYGYGSKRVLLMDFIEQLHWAVASSTRIVVVNGYTPGLAVRDVLTMLSAQVLAKTARLPAQPAAALDTILGALTDKPAMRIALVIHSLDHSNLRNSQLTIAKLASHPQIQLVASCDSPNFALLWDLHLLRLFRFVYHDTTTFAPYTSELDPVLDVNALLGRSGRRFGGKDGVGYVLKSLPENARSLFRILVSEQLALAHAEPDIAAGFGSEEYDDDDVLGVSDEEAALADTPSRRGRGRGRGRPPKAAKKPKAASRPVGGPSTGVEFRTLYHKAVEEFVCSSELNFRTLLKEFHDHQMLESRKDAMGTERLTVPFRSEELNLILEELA
ncbi:ORC2-domain-containing protein [Polychaeton citri CBS 116435]|uniref:Origin recognition complex subunit 2 n=1 Tax=Polychaeton citri CBS 116435 TaxID=1314669 RepID=A0A9P4Q9J7_9PEZI|nr:ORC2-domain-containing protein [Polychaeton citri CBS 116435]